MAAGVAASFVYVPESWTQSAPTVCRLPIHGYSLAAPGWLAPRLTPTGVAAGSSRRTHAEIVYVTPGSKSADTSTEAPFHEAVRFVTARPCTPLWAAASVWAIVAPRPAQGAVPDSKSLCSTTVSSGGGGGASVVTRTSSTR